MLLVGTLEYAGNMYYLHMTSNGSRVRFILFDVYSEEQKYKISIEQDEDELLKLKSAVLDQYLVSRSDVSKLEQYVVGAVQSDKKVKKAFFKGDTFLLNKFIKLYESIVDAEYKEDSDTTITGSDDEIRIVKRLKGDEFISLKRVTPLGSIGYLNTELSFNKDGFIYHTIKEECKPQNAAPFKAWQWEEDIDFSNKAFKRSIISLFAKTLAQLRQEKDLSWYFNKDGTSKKDYRVLHTMDEVREVVKEIEGIRNAIIVKDKNRVLPVAIDCETTGLNMNSLPMYNADGERNPLKDEIGGMSLTWKPDQGVYIPFLHTKFQNVDREQCLTFLKPYLEKWYLETHNGLFDGKAFLDNNIKLNIQDDSMIMLFNINPTVAKGSKGLKENTMARYGHETLDHDDVFPSKKDVTSYYDLTEDIVTIYACADSDYTHRLCTDLRKEVPSVRAYRLDMKVMQYLIKVNYNGNRVDEKLLKKLSSVVDEDILTLEELMYKFVGQIGQLTKFEKVMQSMLRDGKTTKEEIERLRNELMHTDEFKNARYEFSPSKQDVLVDILYNRLSYPIVRVNKNSGKPSADKYALKDLSKEVVPDGERGSWLKEDVMSSSVKYNSNMNYEDMVLIKADTFNSKKYPFVLLLMKWKELMKLKTTFFAWFLDGSCDNMYFSDFSMTNAETSRIIGRIQTLKGAMKQLIIPFSDEYYLMGVDFSQIEARLMAYLAGKWDLVESLCNPRADYHVESASVLTGKEPWKITKAERGELKSVNFAVPYGMAEYSLAENLYGRPVTQDKVEKARVLLAKWKKSNWEIQALLDSHRKFAREEHKVMFFNPETRKLEVTPMRMVINRLGRRRFFSMGKYRGHNLDEKLLMSIDRMSGNYPIQSYAAEIFKTAFVNINKRLEKEGIADKVFITALVHDEFLMNVHRSVDKYKLYQILWEEMVQCIYLPYKDENGEWMKNANGEYVIDKEHPRKYFYAGISIGPEWHDIHGNDAHEAPTEYLMHVVDQIKSGEYKFKDYESGDVTEECFNETKEFMQELLVKECFKWQPDLSKDKVEFYKIVPAFFDYFLKGKLKIYSDKPVRQSDDSDSDDIRAKLETLLMNKLGVNYLVCYDEEGSAPRKVYLNGNIGALLDDELPEITDIDVPALTTENTVAEVDTDNLSDLGDMFGDLFDEDADNFDDEEEEFDISIPIAVYKKDAGGDYKILHRRTDPNDTRDIWDLVDFGKKINTYDAENMNKYMIRSDTIFIDVSEEDITKVKGLIHYIASKHVEHGSYGVKLKLNEHVKDTNIRVNELPRDDIYRIMGWTLFDAVK